VVELGGVRDPARLRRFLVAYAVNSAGTVARRTLSEAAGIDLRTAEAYERLLTDLHVVEPVPAWSTNRLKRLGRSPKRHLADPSLMLTLLSAGSDAAMRDASLLGRLIDTFVMAQLRAEAEVSAPRVRLLHMREPQGRREVDIIAEVDASRVVACEVKAAAAVTPGDARHLASCATSSAPISSPVVVFHTGPRTFALGDRITAAPISTLWARSGKRPYNVRVASLHCQPMAKARRVRRAVERAGWIRIRQTGGSHAVYRRGGETAIFAFHDREDLGGPALAIVAKEFGLTLDELRRLL
jgi:uncharacterized protein